MTMDITAFSKYGFHPCRDVVKQGTKTNYITSSTLVVNISKPCRIYILKEVIFTTTTTILYHL